MHPQELTAPDLRAHLALTLAEVEALTPEERRIRAANLGYDPDACDWANWVLMQSLPERRKREAKIRRDMLHAEGRLSRLRRDGYWFDAEHRLQAPEPSFPRSRQGVFSRAPRSRRARVATRSRSPGSRTSGDDDPHDQHHRAELDLLDAVVLTLGWVRA